MGRHDELDGAASLVLVDGVPLLHPEPQVLEAMLEGWRNQMLARNLATSTITSRTKLVRQFVEHSNAFPWEWSPALADEWFADLLVAGCLLRRRGVGHGHPTHAEQRSQLRPGDRAVTGN